MRYALILNGKILRTHSFESDPPALAANKGSWLPVEDQTEGYDPTVETLVERVQLRDGREIVVRERVARTDLEAVKAEFISRLKAQTTAAILAQAPEFKQRNAALGVYSAEEAEAIRQVILTNRATCDAKEAAILAAPSVQAVWEAFSQ